MLWCNLAGLFGIRAVVSRSYRITWAHIATGDNALREKWSGIQAAEDYQQKILMGKMLTNSSNSSIFFPVKILRHTVFALNCFYSSIYQCRLLVLSLVENN